MHTTTCIHACLIYAYLTNLKLAFTTCLIYATYVAFQVSVELIDWKALTVGRRLGRGAEGAVYEARYQDAPVAIKESPAMNEIEMYLSAGVHDNVVGLRGLCQKDNGTWCLLLEFCGRGTLDTLLHHVGALPRQADMQKLLPMMRGIARGMVHLHTRRPAILHRDLKAANIFVGHGMVMKIGDFGMSRHVYPPMDMIPPHTTGGANGLHVPDGVRSNNPGSTPYSPAQRQGRNSTDSGGGQKPALRTLTAGVVGTMCYAAPEVLDEQLQVPNAPVERVLKVSHHWW